MLKILMLILIFTLTITGCSPSQCAQNITVNANESAIENDNGYINKIIFLGESTTYHLKSRGVLEGGTKTTQVWAPKSGTLMLDTSTHECRIMFPETNEELELSSAIKIKQPEYMMLTFGLNGASGFIKKGEQYFALCYQKLIDAIKSASPKTSVIINSCFPVAKNMDTTNYEIDTQTLNSYIDTINAWAKTIAKKNNLVYLNTSEVLKNHQGFLKEGYHTEDGFHLTAAAYKAILEYIKNNK